MRATLDKLLSWFGLLLVAVLLVAGGLLTWASVFINNQVTDQLGAQHVTMPTSETGLSDLPPADQAALKQYSGQKLTTGAQAEAYATHYTAAPLQGMGGGKPSPEISGQYTQRGASAPRAAAPRACTAPAQPRQSMFMGE